MPPDPSANIDPAELDKFAAVAHHWWDPEGAFKPLHQINPLRTAYIDRHAALAGKHVLDIGCGGGLLCEAMALRGATVTGLDMVEASLEVAKLHGLESGVPVEYHQGTAEDFAAQRPAAFDLVTCLEMLEHVPDPAAVITAAARLVKPGGHVFFSTINRNPKAFAFAIVGAEYLLRLLPKGTHEYAKFIKPSELEAWGREAGLRFTHLEGLHYNPLTQRFTMGGNVDVNYIVHTVKDPA